MSISSVPSATPTPMPVLAVLLRMEGVESDGDGSEGKVVVGDGLCEEERLPDDELRFWG